MGVVVKQGPRHIFPGYLLVRLFESSRIDIKMRSVVSFDKRRDGSQRAISPLKPTSISQPCLQLRSTRRTVSRIPQALTPLSLSVSSNNHALMVSKLGASWHRKSSQPDSHSKSYGKTDTVMISISVPTS